MQSSEALRRRTLLLIDQLRVFHTAVLASSPVSAGPWKHRTIGDRHQLRGSPNYLPDWEAAWLLGTGQITESSWRQAIRVVTHRQPGGERVKQVPGNGVRMVNLDAP
jgi:hypothetical protein